MKYCANWVGNTNFLQKMFLSKQLSCKTSFNREDILKNTKIQNLLSPAIFYKKIFYIENRKQSVITRSTTWLTGLFMKEMKKISVWIFLSFPKDLIFFIPRNRKFPKYIFWIFYFCWQITATTSPRLQRRLKQTPALSWHHVRSVREPLIRWLWENMWAFVKRRPWKSVTNSIRRVRDGKVLTWQHTVCPRISVYPKRPHRRLR